MAVPEIVNKISSDMFETLARTFPIACASDEFYYFPQARLADPQWSIWDCFTSEMVREIVQKLSTWENSLEQLNSTAMDLDDQIDIHLIVKLTRTLQEQLIEVRAWETQPTFYLTLAAIGMAEAMESENPAAKHERAKNLPKFLNQATANLKRIPTLFRDRGMEMVPDIRNYFFNLQKTVPGLKSALDALNRFEDNLKKISTYERFVLPHELLETIVRFHLNCEMDIHQVQDLLDIEIADMSQILNEEAKRYTANSFSDRSSDFQWLQALEQIPVPKIRTGSVIGLYQNEVNQLAQHCIDKRILSSSLVSSCPVRVAPVPAYLSAIRTASSYSISSQSPHAGGTFFILEADMSEQGRKGSLREYQMLSAHETYPGHHLLDASRWNLNRAIRRVVEQPIVYEGWACFAEEIMRITGYFSGPGDRLLLAKRRLWRAIRGKVDLGVQSGTMNMATAAKLLNKVGVNNKHALSSLQKYPLNPAYQLCYTVGIRQFLNLYNNYGHDNLVDFVSTVLKEGEISFNDLEKVLKNRAFCFVKA